jgi:hypothetical protein
MGRAVTCRAPQHAVPIPGKNIKIKLETTMNESDIAWLKNRIAAAVDDDFYLDRDEEKRIKEESATRGFLASDCELTIREELQLSAAVSERLLIDELDRLLHQFTDRDKKLDKKEERDALNKVSIAAAGKKKGLDPRVAEEYVASFCKVNGATRSTDTKWMVPAAGAAVVLVAIVAFVSLSPGKRAADTNAPGAPAQASDVKGNTNPVRLNDSDRADIDDQLRRAKLFIEKAQYTDPPESSAKASLDRIKQSDPNGQYRGDEVKLLSSKIVDHYMVLAAKSAALKDMSGADKWLARARLIGTDSELILEKERALGLAKGER